MMNGETPDPRVDLALRRTEWALERTQLAWVRTAFVIMAAGLTLDMGLPAMFEARVLQGQVWAIAGRVGGVLLPATASALLAVATLGYVRRARELRPCGESCSEDNPSVVALSALVVLLGAAMAVLLFLWG